jgi:hypothetical protein
MGAGLAAKQGIESVVGVAMTRANKADRSEKTEDLLVINGFPRLRCFGFFG